MSARSNWRFPAKVNPMSTTIEPLSPDARPVPENDGIDHINIYSHARTALGQLATNFAHLPLRHPRYGFFASMEAYWYWIKTGKQHDALRRLYGATAKTAGIRLNPVMMPEEQFVNEICDGLKLKVVQNQKLMEALKKSTLPIRHYYVYGTNPPVVKEPRNNLWLWRCLENIRTALKENRPVYLTDGSPAITDPIKEPPENPIPEDIQRYVPREGSDDVNNVDY